MTGRCTVTRTSLSYHKLAHCVHDIYVCLQAELVAQFLCCIPLAAVEVVLAWLKPVVPDDEQRELLGHVRVHAQHATSNCSITKSAEPEKHECFSHPLYIVILHTQCNFTPK